MSNGAAPLTPIDQIAPDITSQFDQFLSDNPEQVSLAPTDPSKVARSTQPPPEAPPEPRAEIPDAPPVEDPTDELAEPEATLETEDGADPEAAAEVEEDLPPQVESLEQMAAVFEDEGVTADSLLDLTVAGRGEGETVSLREALEHYRTGPTESEHFTARVEGARLELEEAHDLRLQETSMVLTGLVEATHAEFEGVNWDTLKTESPERYIELSDRRDLLNQRINAAIEHMKAEQSRRAQAQEVRGEAYTADQVLKLQTMNPSWSDPQTGATAMTEVSDYMKTAGFTPQQRKGIRDAREIQCVWEAAQWRKLQASKPEVRNRLRTVPRTMRATARAAEQAPREQAREQRAAAKQAHSERGTVESAAAAFREIGVR